MKTQKEALYLKIFISETDKHNGKPLYEAIVLKAKELNLAGATVFRGILGFGAHHRIHQGKLLELSEDMPLVVEIIDTKDNVDKILPFLDEVVTQGLVTIEKLDMIEYRAV
jgi:uncharacterized protein